MNILLINPVNRIKDKPRNIPHGIAIIASVLISHDYKVKILDLNALRLTRQETELKLKSYEYDIVGIGGLIPVYKEVKWLSHKIKFLNPECKVIVGGSVGSSIPDLILNNCAVDIVINGEGENTVLDIVHAIKTGSFFEEVRGIWFKDKSGEVIKTADRPVITDMDSIPYPAWDLLPMDIYLKNPVVGIGKDIDFISSRGCPYQCIFCYQQFGRKFRGHSVEYIIEGIKKLKLDYDIDFISFQDDEFMASQKRFINFCNEFRKTGLKIKWSCTGRANLNNKEVYKLAKQTGCVSISYGIESGSQQILDTIKKSVKVEQAKQAILVNREVGIRAPTSFIIGLPGENNNTCQETVDFCIDLNIPLGTLMFATPYPGTELFNFAKKTGKITEENLENFILQLGDAVDFTINLTDYFTDAELIKKRQEMLKEVNSNISLSTSQEELEFNIELFGKELWEKSRDQRMSKEFIEHRKLHGFNENLDVLSE